MSNPHNPWGNGTPHGYAAPGTGGPTQGAPYSHPQGGYHPHAATNASLQAAGANFATAAKSGAIRFVAIMALSGVVIGGVMVKKAIGDRPNLLFLHNVRAVTATVTVDGAPRGSVASTEVLEVPIEPGTHAVVSTFADGQSQTLQVEVPPREGMFTGFRAVGLLGNAFQYARVTVRYPSYGGRPTVVPLTTQPQSLVVLPAGASRETINTGFPRSMSVRRGSSVSVTHYCPITADGDVPCLH